MCVFQPTYRAGEFRYLFMILRLFYRLSPLRVVGSDMLSNCDARGEPLSPSERTLCAYRSDLWDHSAWSALPQAVFGFWDCRPEAIPNIILDSSSWLIFVVGSYTKRVYISVDYMLSFWNCFCACAVGCSVWVGPNRFGRALIETLSDVCWLCRTESFA